ncbi:1-acyl-sn-glycerol-3-phosphate acyltransferase [Demequina zhanjiangensis]|uniref:1-acyl-sn-glycerol-3-phosphate acyltransferase n=1 Tax=Demequina zhanjiangensis TaxID=3051659 RepID=A0ABT8G2Y6_9MICO|nr:1-acyl-sn-glycerol-3-phosphate acyltransferase [Demequina sp. SYSU T00b26]MDN4473503.1 1-acyl-sn-glycerol-3-phosphate acyltransferase [Demequina sp. SYSU T00b26]
MSKLRGLRLPPIWVRRAVIAPLVVFVALAVMPVSLLLLAAVAGIVSWALPGRLRVTRIFAMAVFYLMWDAFALICLFLLWVGSGFGLFLKRPGFQAAHYTLTSRLLALLFWQVRWTLRLDIVHEDADLDEVAKGLPAIVVSRHAGPGDSFVIVEALLNRYSRDPMIVLKDTMQWDPAIDVLLHRIPSRFVTPRRYRRSDAPGGSEAVGQLAAGMDDDDAVLIFPEGANATPKRRAARIASLRAAGHDALADRAEAMPHVMPPHVGGVMAAMEACPRAAVIVVAHTGLERLSTIRDVWRELPVDKRITMKGWTAMPEEIPQDAEERTTWLFDWWARVDAWIDGKEVAVSAAASEGRLTPGRMRLLDRQARIDWALVGVQALLFLGVGFWPPQWSPDVPGAPLWGLAVVLVGAVGLAVSGFHLGRALTPLPTPNGTGLVAKGLYRWARHPLYTAVVMICAGVAVARGEVVVWGFVVLLALFFEFKTRLEESYLLRTYDGYADYAARTGKFLPWLGRRR